MTKSISLFSGYSQGENRTTNYCLLLLKMLYEENPKFLAEIMSGLVGDNLGERIGVQFRQQERKHASVPDGVVWQQAFTVYIETKNSDRFYPGQLEKHLAALDKERDGLKILIALANFETADREKFDPIHRLCTEKYKDSILFADVSFEELLKEMKHLQLPKNLSDTVVEFEAYLNEQDLLPTWERTLDVINCAREWEEVMAEQVYFCGTSGGAYSHKRCKFFGMYRKKTIAQVALIEAVIDVEDIETATVKWQNVSGSENDLKERARERWRRLRPEGVPQRIFLLGPLFQTDCRKDTSGGMLGSKQYFDIGYLAADNAEVLARALLGKTWSEILEQTSA